jgi:NADH dehydrogenase [ubiquinone] 1 alpha subcomplex assembly factor 3
MYGLEAGFNEVRRDRTYVDSLHKGGFTINKRRHAGPVLLLRNLALSWKVPADMSALSQDCFDVFAFVEPVPSLIILGTGNTLRYLNADVLKALRSLAPVEVLGELAGAQTCSAHPTPSSDSRNAVATFNILTQEDRIVGAALLPLT